jgi:hypothetical protein
MNTETAGQLQAEFRQTEEESEPRMNADDTDFEQEIAKQEKRRGEFNSFAAFAAFCSISLGR